jgi:predicted ATP-grasp superfamily ATP-dependent carboligase
VVVEVNPRLTVAYAGLSAARDGNLASALLAAHGVRIEATAAASRACAAHEACGARP